MAAHFSTRSETQASFNQAEWTQEDVSDGAAGKPSPYPRLTAVVFRGLTVNSAMPAYADLYSSWMSVDGGYLAPSSPNDDSFSLRRATVSSSGAQYLRIATGDDVATKAFVTQMSGWSAATPYARIESARSKFATALRNNILALGRARCPRRVRGPLDLLLRNTQAVLADSRSAVPPTSSGRAAWKSKWMRDAAAIGSAAHAVKRVLDLPEIRPAP